ncbi:MAG: hypothetical protein IT362_04760 [Deltaproteobacteria bacterium]|nr:hypothetical protein [Deltaproteobacteria bacterium]
MIELISHVAKAESALAGSLSAASIRGTGEGARRLKKLAMAKRRLAREFLSGASRIRATSRRPPLMRGLRSVRDDFDASLLYLVAAIESGIEEAGLAEALACHERFKWNNLVLSLAAAVRGGFPEGVPMLAAAGRGRRAVEGYVELAGCAQELFSLKAAAPAWKERLLLIGELPPETEAALESECVLEKTVGTDAIDRITRRYYGALIAVDGLNDMKASTLCERAARIFPGIEERFLYLYESAGGKGAKDTEPRARHLPRSSSKSRVMEEVGLILNR